MNPSKKLVTLTAAFLLVSQPFQAFAQQPGTEPPPPVIRVSTHVVLVDAIVTDRSGKVISDLKPEDFTIKENGKPQKISSFKFEERRAAAAVTKLPEGVLSNRPETKIAPGPMTVILLDALNTTVANQQFARQQMLRYVQNQYQPGQQIAVYALTNKLIRIHDFTGSADELIAALNAFTTSATANQPGEISKVNTVTFSKPTRGGDSEAVNVFINDSTPTVKDARIQTTLAGMRELARQLGGYPGRKNIVWVSTGFDIAFSPDEGNTTVTSGMIESTVCPTCPPPLPNELQAASANITTNNIGRFVDEIHRTSAVMADSRVALYPVDARGLFNISSTTSAASTGDPFANQFVGLNANVAGLTSSQDNMKELARQTGGVAYYNRNDIDHGVAQATADGGSYYLISYASGNKKFDGAYRNIKVEVNRPGVQVRNRPGYFAYDIQKAAKGKSNDSAASLREMSGDSSMVLFDAMVQSQSAAGGKSTVAARFLVDPKSISWGDTPDKPALDVDFYFLAVGADGMIAANTGKTVAQPLDPNVFAQVMKQGLPVEVDAELPTGSYSVSLKVRDNRTGLYGSVSTSVTVK